MVVPFLLLVQLFLTTKRAEDAQFARSPFGSGVDDVRLQHGQPTVIVQPPDVDGALPLLQLEPCDVVDHI